MSQNSAESGFDPTEEIRLAMTNWSRLTNEIINDALRIGQPLVDSYFRSLTKGFMGLAPCLEKTHSSHCEIPKTECPPRCVCKMSWDACEGDSVRGTIEVLNTGKQASRFSLSADTFRSDRNNSGVAPKLNPGSFDLAAGDSMTIQVSVDVGDTFDPDDTYESEIRVIGRYEQCVRLSLFIRRRMTPHCRVEQGEIPTRIVVHHWYDHFQCEELCFEPVLQRGDQPKGVVVARKKTVVGAAAAKKRIAKRSRKTRNR